MFSSALFSPCYKYRYVLTRVWDFQKPCIQFIGLNPSTADGIHNDPTIKKAIKLCRAWGYGGFYMTNLFAYRTPYPKVLKTISKPIGPENEFYILECNQKSALTVLMWGNHGQWSNRDQVIINQLQNTYCLHINKTGCPAHILYQPDNAVLKAYMPV